MNEPPQPSPVEEDRVDEAVAESFPASDAPAWSAVHAGGPAPARLWPEHSHELVRASIRTDVERLSQAFESDERRRASREDIVARALLDAGRSVVREPIDGGLVVRTLEAEQVGGANEDSCVVVGARYDEEDASAAAMLLALARALAPARTRRALRFAAFADVRAPSVIASGSAVFAQRLLAARSNVHAMLSLGRLDFARERRAAVVFAGAFRSMSLLVTARETFRRASRIGAHALPLPGWLASVRAADHTPFEHMGWPAMVVADGVPWKVRTPSVPDADLMAVALPGLLAVVVQLAGGFA